MIDKKVVFLFLVIAALCFLFTIWLFSTRSLSGTSYYGIHLQKTYLSQKTGPLILYWGYPWGLKSYIPKEGSKIGKCTTTSSRSRLQQADAVIFHYTTITKSDIPWRRYRNRSQLFIWWSAEAPPILKTSGYNLKEFDGGFFNWTRTYRRDSDIPFSYGHLAKLFSSVEFGNEAVDKVIASKKKLATWFVSGCDYTKGAQMRFKYAMSLREAGLNFSGYGKCFKQKENIRKSQYDLGMRTMKQHKFYFAFENAYHCTDYITEKFWQNALSNGAVPIVYGPKKEDVLRVAPLDSFIFAEDFESPKKLVEYLNFLDSNNDEYRKYFRWREDKNMTATKMLNLIQQKYPNLQVAPTPSQEAICDKILKHTGTKIINSLNEEFMEKKTNECLGVEQK